MNVLISKIEDIVRKNGDILLNANYNNLNVESKDGIGNIVTEYDKIIQNNLKEELTKLIPNSLFIGEESNVQESILEEGYTFIVDPIDGTTNFSRKLNLSAISVALLKNGKPYIGVCFNPYTDEMFKAEKEKGAFLNERKIRVSDKKLSEGILLSGFAPYYKELRDQTLNIQRKLSMIASDYRRIGSAVLELCYIACGRAEVYFELKLQPWDCAAGALIVEESGGKVTTIDGKNIDYNKPTSILATNNKEDYYKYIDNQDCEKDKCDNNQEV